MSDTVGGHVYVNGLEGGQDISPAPGTEDEAAFEAFYAGFCKPDQAPLIPVASPAEPLCPPGLPSSEDDHA